jgi:serine/threonine-protein kinase
MEPSVQPTGSFLATPTAPPATEPTPGAATSVECPAPAAGAVGPYELLQEIAQGGMGVVYKARHKTLGRVVALKTTRDDVGGHRQNVARFEREMQVVARLRHPNIVPIYDVGSHDGRAYFTMPFFAGGSMAYHRPRLAAEPARAVALMEKVARSVHHAHEHGILHRDLKPSNILLEENDEPVVSDFGLAKVEGEEADLTQTGAVLGTPAYMAPEQAAGRLRDIGPATDVWALGVMLYELLAGHRPFVGESSDEVKMKILLERPSALRKACPNLPPALEAVILKCLEKEPGRRYATAGALADELARCRGLDWRRPGPAARVGQALRRRWGLAAMGGLALVAAVTGGVLFFGLSGDPAVNEEPAPPTEVTLLGDVGPPEKFHWAVGSDDAKVRPDGPNEPFAIGCPRLALLELLPAPPWPAYRIEAEVRQLSGQAAECGFYFNDQTFATAQGNNHLYLKLGFGDLGTHVGLRGLEFIRAEDFGRRSVDPVRFIPQGILKLNPGNHWRQLVVNVTDKEVVAFFDGEHLATAPGKSVKDRYEHFLGILQAPQRLRPPEAGLGIYVQRGEAAFRRIVVRRLP